MAIYEVEVTRSITSTVTVEADTPEAAHKMVNRRDFELPPRGEWQGSKDWVFVVYDQEGRELGRDDEGSGYYDTADDEPEHTADECRAYGVDPVGRAACEHGGLLLTEDPDVYDCIQGCGDEYE